MEVPVVTTSIVAAGMRTGADEDPPLWIADGREEFARSVVNLLGRPEEQRRLAAEGRRYVEKHYDWSRSARQLERMCFEALEVPT